MKNMKFIFTGIVFSLGLASTNAAIAKEQNSTKELEVIHHDRSAVSALRYYDSLSIQSGERAIEPLPNNLAEKLNEFKDGLFPVESNLSPGHVSSRTISAPGLIQPVFIVGYDDLSLSWLHERAEILQELGAVGFVTNVPNAESMNHMQQLAGNIPLLPIPADDIAASSKVTNYPVLITRNSIEQ